MNADKPVALRDLVDVDQLLKYSLVGDEHRLHTIGEPSGRLLFLLAMLSGPGLMCEIGTGYGYSLVWLAAAAKRVGARVVTFEVDSNRSARARTLLGRFGLEDIADFRVEDAREGIKKLDGAPTLVLVDGRKAEYADYLQAVVERLAGERCVLVADNMLSHRSELHAFVESLSDPAVTVHELVATGKGLEVCLLNAGGAPAY